MVYWKLIYETGSFIVLENANHEYRIDGVESCELQYQSLTTCIIVVTGHVEMDLYDDDFYDEDRDWDGHITDGYYKCQLTFKRGDGVVSQEGYIKSNEYKVALDINEVELPFDVTEWNCMRELECFCDTARLCDDVLTIKTSSYDFKIEGVDELIDMGEVMSDGLLSIQVAFIVYLDVQNEEAKTGFFLFTTNDKKRLQIQGVLIGDDEKPIMNLPESEVPFVVTGKKR